MLRYVKRIVSTASLLLLIGAGVGLVALQLQGGKLMSVQTGSMEPDFGKGSLVAVMPAETSTIQIGDVITYKNPLDKTQTITHRVTGTMESMMGGGKPYFITKGDANPAPDQPVPAGSVIGRVGFNIPYAGYAVDQMRKPLGLLLMAYIPALIIIIYELHRLARHYRTIKPYTVYENRPRDYGPAPLVVVVVAAGFVLAIAGTAGTALAAFSNNVALTGNTIKSAPLSTPQEPPSVPGTNKTCTNKSNVNKRQHNYQSARSGDASVKGNPTGGNAQSGRASNQNSSNVSVNIENNCQIP